MSSEAIGPRVRTSRSSSVDVHQHPFKSFFTRPVIVSVRFSSSSPAVARHSSMRGVPSTMRAAVLRSFGGPEALRVASDVPVPSCGPREVLVRVAAASVDPSTVACGRGTAGRCTSRCSRWCSAATSAARSWRAATPHARSPRRRRLRRALPRRPARHPRRVRRRPRGAPRPRAPGWSHIDAAAVPFAALTAWRALHHRQPPPGRATPRTRRGRRRRAAATHLASARACPVAVTCAESDASRLVDAGAFDAWDYRSDVSLTAHAKTRDWAPFDVALDCVGGVKSERAATRLLRKGVGRVVTLHGALAGR